jgi:hypothetical protein
VGPRAGQDISEKRKIFISAEIKPLNLPARSLITRWNKLFWYPLEMSQNWKIRENYEIRNADTYLRVLFVKYFVLNSPETIVLLNGSIMACKSTFN